MVNIVKLLRSATLGNRPTGAALVAGAPYVNFADKQFGVVDSTPTPQDLIGVPFFSASANYSAGQPINYLGQLYVALSAVTAGAWNPAQWSLVGTTSSAVRYDVSQGLTANQQAQARSNIGTLKKNYIINGAMMISQENGTTSGIVNIGNSFYYGVDCFQTNLGGSAGAIGVQQVAVASPGGSPNRLRVSASVVDVSVGASDIVYIDTYLEGLRVADLRFGSATAKTVTIQFGVKAPAGTYCLTLLNVPSNRSYVSEYVIAAGEANTDVVKQVTVAGDVAGTWAVDNTRGIIVRWGLMTGSTFQQAAGSWGTTNAVGSANQFNLLGGANVFELFDVSLTEGNVAPPFVVPDYASELRACQRYWQWGGYGLYGFASGTTAAVFACSFSVNFRAAPTISLTSTALNLESLPFAVSVSVTGAAMGASYPGVKGVNFRITGTLSPSVTAGTAATLVTENAIKFSARL